MAHDVMRFRAGRGAGEHAFPIRLARGQRVGMQIGGVGEVEQIVDQQPIIDLHDQMVLDPGVIGPLGIAEQLDVGNERRVGRRRLAHPDPRRAMAFDHRIGRHIRAGGNFLAAMRIVDAGARAVEAQPVIGAFDDVADSLALVQRREAVGAHVADGDDIAGLPAKQQHRFVEKPARNRRLADLRAPAGTIPGISEIGHARPPSFAAASTPGQRGRPAW